MAGFNITNKNVDSLFKTAEKGVVVDGDKKDSNDTNSTDNTISADNAGNTGSTENTANTDNKNVHNDNTAVSYTHLTLPTTARRCRSRWSPYH